MVDNIGGIGGMGPAQARKLKFQTPTSPASQSTDGVELSSDVMRLRGMDGIRLDKVMEVRRAVQAGTYLTPEKLDKALNLAIDDALGQKK